MGCLSPLKLNMKFLIALFVGIPKIFYTMERICLVLDPPSDIAINIVKFVKEKEDRMKMTKGMYKGQNIEDIPTDYLEYCLREWDQTDEQVEAMENVIKLRAGEGVSRRRD